jgi:CRISPR-associated protein Cas1
MLTLPDFREKQILFILCDNNAENKIRFHNDNIVFEKDGKVENRASCHKVFSVFIIGHISITSELIRRGVEYGISFFLLKNNFNCYASINSLASGNYLLRKQQYLLTNEKALLMSKNLVLNKVRNQFVLLKSKNKLEKLSLSDIEISIKNACSLENLLGIEGNLSKEFFSRYFKDIGWYARMPRVKPDAPNFLLDMGYTFLFNFIDSLLNLFGFDTYKGFYHQLFFQRKSLTCDIVEPFRSIVDREVSKIFSLKIFNQNDFKIKEGKFNLKYDKSQKYALRFFNAIMDYKEEIYNYVINFYRFMMDNKKYTFPFFKLHR